MPSGQFSSVFVRGIESNRNWYLVFFNNKQKMLVDVTTPQGRELFDGIRSGKTLYPDDFSKNLVIAHNMLSFGKGKDAKRQGLDFAIKAFNSRPSQAPMREIIFAAGFAGLRSRVNDFCENFINDFAKNKDNYAKEDGYYHKVVVALLASDYLQRIAERKKDAKLMEFYTAKKQEYENEQKRVLKGRRW